MPRLKIAHRPKSAVTPPSLWAATVVVMPSPVTTLASRLDREADAELAMGHISAAERLSWRAAALREVGA